MGVGIFVEEVGWMLMVLVLMGEVRCCPGWMGELDTYMSRPVGGYADRGDSLLALAPGRVLALLCFSTGPGLFGK